MGLHEKTNSHNNFLSIKHGGICLESKEPVQGYEETIVDDISKTLPDGTHPKVTKYVKKFVALDGKITRVEWYDRQDGNVRYLGVKLHVRDGGQYFQIDLPFGKPHYDYFTKVMDNIDFANKVEFNAWRDRKDPRRTAFVIKQGGNYVEWAYTRDNMGECPPAVQNRSGKWSFEAQREWLLARLQDVIIPAVEEINRSNEPEPEYEPEGGQDDPPTQSIAGNLRELVTAKQLGLIRSLARELRIDADEECKSQLNCVTDELSKTAANWLIKHLKGLGQTVKTPALQSVALAATASNDAAKKANQEPEFPPFDPQDDDVPDDDGYPF